MNESVISWSIVNWITVFLMVTIGFVIFGGGLAIVNRVRSAKGMKDA